MDRRDFIKLTLMGSFGFVSKEEWGALPAKEDPLKVLYTTMGIFDRTLLDWFAIHHSGLDLKGTSVKTIQEYHLRKKADIAYNWVIDKEGFVFEGRPWYIMGAAMCPSEQSLEQVERYGRLVRPEVSLNYGVLNVCLIGDFTKGRPTEEQIESLYDLSVFVADNFPSVSAERIIGHRDSYLIAQEKGVNGDCETECPGNIEDVIEMTRIHFQEASL